MLIVTGLQGVGVKTFIERTKGHDIPAVNLIDFGQQDTSPEKSYESTLGPSRTRAELLGFEHTHNLLNFLFSKRYKEIMDPTSQLAYQESYGVPMFKVFNSPCVSLTTMLLETYPEDDNTYVLITAPRESQIERLVAKNVPTDHRLTGKRNYMYLVRPEIEKELDAREHFVDQLRDRVDYHIHNDGELNQYYAAIDQVLDAENLLN